jgi:hypothetical protein
LLQERHGVNIPEDGILNSRRRENLKSYIDFYIPKGGILQGHRRGNLKSYIALTGWAL